MALYSSSIHACIYSYECTVYIAWGFLLELKCTMKIGNSEIPFYDCFASITANLDKVTTKKLVDVLGRVKEETNNIKETKTKTRVN